ncbi:MAG: hypothetical protein AABW50_04770 [Nanoarchaeota archaeon]
MKLFGFNITKINAEKFSGSAGELKINTKLDIKEILDSKSETFKIKEELISVDFVFSIDYDPNLAHIEIGGRLVLGLDSKIAKDVLKEWKDKKISEEFRIFLFNIILKKASLKALEIEEDMNLPFHIQFPSFKKADEKE